MEEILVKDILHLEELLKDTKELIDDHKRKLTYLDNSEEKAQIHYRIKELEELYNEWLKDWAKARQQLKRVQLVVHSSTMTDEKC